MIVCQNRALSESLRDRCQRTGIGTMLPVAKQIQHLHHLFIIPFAVLLLRALRYEFARILQAIIHAVQKLKIPEL
jgi:hypothetical protein